MLDIKRQLEMMCIDHQTACVWKKNVIEEIQYIKKNLQNNIPKIW